MRLPAFRVLSLEHHSHPGRGAVKPGEMKLLDLAVVSEHRARAGTKDRQHSMPSRKPASVPGPLGGGKRLEEFTVF